MTTFTSEDREQAQILVDEAPFHPGYEDAVIQPTTVSPLSGKQFEPRFSGLILELHRLGADSKHFETELKLKLLSNTLAEIGNDYYTYVTSLEQTKE